jgi:outer membrane receptor protein involved in Fe transport
MTKRTSIGRVSLLLSSCAAVLWSVPALAQDEPQSDPGEAQAQTAATDDQADIVITATRQEQNLSRVPISVSAYSQETLDEQGVRRVDDIARLTPGVTFTRGDARNAGAATISIRGIASTAGSATTGIYIDDTPIQIRSIGFSAFNPFPAIFDLERVEVLRGPQGTLFGAGSEGGTVRFITPRPDLDEFRAYGRAELASTKSGALSYEAGAAASVPLVADQLAVRGSAYYRRDGGFIDRVDFDRVTHEPTTLVDKNANSVDTVVLAASLGWAPSDVLTITPSIYYQKLTSDESNAYWEVLSDPDESEYRTGTAIPNTNRDKFLLPALKVDLELGPVNIISNTSYFDRDQEAINDYTAFETGIWAGNPFYPEGVFAQALQINKQENFTQEVRVQSADPDARLNWVVGVFYSRNRQTAQQFVENEFLDDPVLLGNPIFPGGPTLFDVIFGGVPLVDGRFTFVLDKAVAIDKQIAGFGQVDFKATDKLTLTAGLRVAKTDFSATARFHGPVVGPEVNDEGSQKEEPITPKFGISYQADPGNMFYASAAKGFRIGGYNPAVGLPCGVNPGGDPIPNTSLGILGLTDRPTLFDSDSVWSYELGSKNRVFGDRLQVNASAFYIDWKNIQQTVGLARCGFQFVANLGSATSKGFDLQFNASLTDELTIGGSVGYTKAEFDETVFGGPARGPGVLPIVTEGDDIPLNPWQIYLNGQYETDVLGTRGYARFDFQHLSKQKAMVPFTNPANGGTDTTIPNRPAVTTLSLRAGVRFDNFDLSVFVNNVFNDNPELTRARTPGPIAPDPNALYTNSTLRPRTIGVTGTFRY